MGVYIPGMEMPTNCRKCGLMMNCDDCEGLQCYCLPLKKSIGNLEKFRDEPCVLTDKRRDDCPLIPVPEHGRLIDADALAESHRVRAYQCTGNSYSFHMTARAWVNDAQTIIPADKEGEG